MEGNSMLTSRTGLTFKEYLALPETMQRYEIIDGELIVSPSPDFEHQWRSTAIYDPMKQYVHANRLGIVLYAPLDIMIQQSPLRTRQPDILYMSLDRIRQFGLDSIKGVPFFSFPPDLVVEIVSPSESKRRIEGKLKDYCKIGVREGWLVRPEEQTIEVLQLSANSFQQLGLFGRGDALKSEVLPGWNPAIDDFFASPDFLKWLEM
jgi:Uma2 family endonuclease